MDRDPSTNDVKVIIPTYNAYAFADEVAAGKMQEFDSPHVPVLIRRADGIRVVLGTHDFDDQTKPDIQIERRPNGWAIFLHPLGGGDPSGCIYFVDGGESIFRHESHVGTTPKMAVREWDDHVDEVDVIEDPVSELFTDDDLLNSFATAIEDIGFAMKDVSTPHARLKLIRIMRRLKTILRAI